MIGTLSFAIPCESVIKKELRAFHANSIFNQAYFLAGYDGLRNLPSDPSDEDNRRHYHYQTVRSLFSFASDCIPDMKNGHTIHNSMIPMRATIDRCLVLKLSSGEIIGATFFRINLSVRRALLANLSINQAHRKRGLGAFLWHAATLVSLLYGCEMLTGCSIGDGVYSSEVKRFYEKRGCTFHRVDRKKLYEVETMAAIDLKTLALNEIYMHDQALLTSYDSKQWLTRVESMENENEATPPTLTTRHLKDLHGFLIETDPFFAEKSAFDSIKSVLFNCLKLSVSCKQKRIDFDQKMDRLLPREKMTSPSI